MHDYDILRITGRPVTIRTTVPLIVCKQGWTPAEESIYRLAAEGKELQKWLGVDDAQDALGRIGSIS